MKQKTTAIVLFSGGLDSMLTCRVLMEQGIRVQAVKFVTPFFGYELLERQDEYRRQVAARYGIEVMVRDVSAKYLELLRNPPHGFGKNFNPCVDCKILLVSEARQLMAEYGASFLATGEVLGQRPMSQRQDTLRIIERESGSEGLLLRPLCAQRLKPTIPESEGLVDRNRLLGFTGRSRQPQIELAARFGITDFPSPAGGCVLTDPILSRRIRRFYEEQESIAAGDIRLLLAGRSFRLPGGALAALGRNMRENDRIQLLAGAGDWLLLAADRPGPTALVRFLRDRTDLEAAAGLVARYCKRKGEPVMVTAQQEENVLNFSAFPPQPDHLSAWVR